MAVREVKGPEVCENGNSETSEQRQENDQQTHSSLNHPVLSSTTASGRTILFEGDGSFQMSAQELSTIIKHELDLTLFLINNDGYVIERFIHGMKATYNDVAPWRYLDAPYFFGAQMEGGVAGAESVNGIVGNGRDGHNVSDSNGSPLPQQPEKSGEGRDYKIQTYQARTWGELLSITSKPEVRSGKGLCMIEVFMGREDAPESLKRLVANVKRRNSGESEREVVDGGREGEGKVVEEKVMKAAG
jgi:pyruvate decarboxylase